MGPPASSIMMTPPASPITLQRRALEETHCPSHKRKRRFGNDLDTELIRLDRRSRNRRRSLASKRHRALERRHDHANRWCLSQGGPLPMLSIEDLRSAPSVPAVDAVDTVGAPPKINLKPRVTSYKTEAAQHGNFDLALFQDDDAQGQDENAPPSMTADEASETAPAVSSSNVPGLPPASAFGSDHEEHYFLQEVTSPPPKSKHLCRSSSTGSGCGFSGTPLSQLTLSISKRKLSFGRRDSRSISESDCYQTPSEAAARATNTLIESLEGLCLPSLEDGLVDEPTEDTATSRLQQKRPPSTPGQNQNRALSTFDYLATALRLPDMAGLSGGHL